MDTNMFIRFQNTQYDENSGMGNSTILIPGNTTEPLLMYMHSFLWSGEGPVEVKYSWNGIDPCPSPFYAHRSCICSEDESYSEALGCTCNIFQNSKVVLSIVLQFERRKLL